MKNKLEQLRVWLCQRTPYHLQWAIDQFGITFPYNGDHLVWCWWWKRNGQAHFISTMLSSDGDAEQVARFDSLAEYRDTMEQLQDELTKWAESMKAQYLQHDKLQPGNN